MKLNVQYTKADGKGPGKAEGSIIDQALAEIKMTNPGATESDEPR